MKIYTDSRDIADARPPDGLHAEWYFTFVPRQHWFTRLWVGKVYRRWVFNCNILFIAFGYAW